MNQIHERKSDIPVDSVEPEKKPGWFKRIMIPKKVIGLGVFHAPKEGSVLAMLSQLTVQPAMVTEPALMEIIEGLIGKADRDMRLKGELISFFRTHYDQVLVHLRDTPASDYEIRNFLRAEYRGRKRKYKRYSSHVRDVVIVAVFGKC